jgi:5-methylcytosine-specific restriction endonuclease McrA
MAKSRKKEIRARFRQEVFERDNWTCQVCGDGSYHHIDHFDAHHITDRSEMPNGGYVKENGITVCKRPKWISFVEGEDGLPDIEIDNESCHMKCEKYHLSGGKEWYDGLHPDDLYKKIGSSKEKAIRESLKL